MSPIGRLLTVAAATISAAIAPAQELIEQWRRYETSDSQSSFPCFVKQDRTVHFIFRYDDITGANAVFAECRDTLGGLIWNRDIGTLKVESAMPTTDNLVYYTQDNRIAAITQDGAPAWTTITQSVGNDADYTKMRIFGDLLLVAGRTRIASTPAIYATVLHAVNRFTGVPVYTKTFGSSPTAKTYDIGAANGKLFLLTDSAAHGTRTILKIEPTSGEILGHYRSDTLETHAFAVDSASTVYAVGDGPTMRRLNASGSGPFDLVYSRSFESDADLYDDVILSGGSIYLAERGDSHVVKYILKVRPSDGVELWKSEAATDYKDITNLAADKHGRISFHVQEFRGTLTTWLKTIDPVDGHLLDSFRIADASEGVYGIGYTFAALNTYGDFAIAGTAGFSGFSARVAQTMEPQNDTYDVPAGAVFTTSGNGALSNDRYVNPNMVAIDVVVPPLKGSLYIHPNGELYYDATNINAGDYSFTYRINRNGEFAQATGILKVRRGLTGLSLTRSLLAGQNATLGTVRVARTSNAFTTVQIWDDSSLVTTPASATITPNQTSGNFGVQVQSVNAQINTTIYASFGGFTRTVPLTLTPLVPTAMEFSPASTVTGGTTVTCRLVVNGVAGPGGRMISIYDNSPYSTVPAQVTVPAGQTQVHFEITTTNPPTTQISRITAAVSAGQISANLRITPTP